jgi:hypothetical protein
MHKIFEIKGRLPVKLPSTQTKRSFGFKIILLRDYPHSPPLVYLDEPVNEEVIGFVDYLDEGNVIMFKYLTSWQRDFENIQSKMSLAQQP